MSCPFLNRFPPNFLKNYAQPLVKQFIQQCPVMGHRGIGTFGEMKSKSSDPKLQASFPFLKEIDLDVHVTKPADSKFEDHLQNEGN